MTQITIYPSTELLDELKKRAKEESRSLNNLIILLLSKKEVK